MAIDVTCECGREFGVTNDSVGRSVKCPECGTRVRVSEDFVAVEQERGTSDLANDPEHQTPELRPLLPGLSLAVTETGWRLVASTRSLTQALPLLMGGIYGIGMLGFLIWVGSLPRKPGDSWAVPLLLGYIMCFSLFPVFVCLGAMRLFGRIEISIEGDHGTVFTGVGNIGRTQHFDWTDAVEIQDQHMTGRGVEYHEIVLHAAKKIRTGKFLTKEQSSEMLQALRQLQRTQPSDDYS